MIKDLQVPWKRYALIVELAQRLHGVHPQFGKTALQKLIYLLQAVYDVDGGYDFRLYTYGPFDSQVLQDLDLVESFGGVKVDPVREGLDGYRIEPDKNDALVKEQAESSIEDISGDLDALVKDYGAYNAKELEMRATIVFVEREMGREDSPVSAEDLVEVVHSIKPYFSEHEIKSAVKELNSKGHVKVAADG